jgi:hypothetical protein
MHKQRVFFHGQVGLSKRGGRDFAPAGEFLSGGAQKGTKDALGDTCRGTRCALVRCAQTATASQAIDGRTVSQQSCGRSAEKTSTAMQHAQVKRHSASRARASVAHRNDVLLISGGCVSVAPQARSEFRRTAACQARLFFGHFLLAKQKKATRPPGRTPGLCPCMGHGGQSMDGCKPNQR